MHPPDLKTIDIHIAGRRFPVDIKPDEEASVREMETMLNLKIKSFQDTYPGREKIDYVIMTLLSHVYDTQSSSQQEEPSAALLGRIQEIQNVLGNV